MSPGYGHTRAFRDSLVHEIPWPDSIAPSTLATCWEQSRQTLNRVRHLLTAQVPDGVIAVAVSGSLGRMEQVTQSDLDVIIVVQNEASERESRAAWESVWQVLDTLDLSRPKAGGIYSKTTCRSELCNDADLGIVDQDIGVFGRRIQLLLDCQPIIGQASYEACILEILEFYAIRHAELSSWEWDGLIADLLRYYRAMDNSCRWHPQEDHTVWRERNLKLRFSRRANVFSLIGILLMSSQQADRPDWVVSQLSLTPLERIMQFTDGASRQIQLAQAYSRFLQYLELPNDAREAEFPALLEQAKIFAEALHESIMKADSPWSARTKTLLVGN